MFVELRELSCSHNPKNTSNPLINFISYASGAQTCVFFIMRLGSKGILPPMIHGLLLCISCILYPKHLKSAHFSTKKWLLWCFCGISHAFHASMKRMTFDPSIIILFLRQQLQNLIVACDEFGHLIRVQRLVCDHCQIVELFTDHRNMLIILVLGNVLYELVVCIEHEL